MIRLNAQKSKTILGALALIAIALAIGGAATLIYAMETEYDPAIMHFDVGSFGAATAAVICALGAAIAVVGFFTTTNKLSFEPDGKFSFAEVFVSTLAGLLCFFYLYLGIVGGKPESKIGVFYAEMALSALAGVYFMLKASGLTDKHPSLNLFALFPALMSAFTLLRLYFNSNEPLNAPLKTFEIVMTVSYMLGFTANAGVSILRPKMSRKFVFASLFAASAGGMVSISRVASRLISPDTFDFNIVRETFRLVFWLYLVTSFAVKYFSSREIAEDVALIDNEEEKTADADAKTEAEAETAAEAEAETETEAETAAEAEAETETEAETAAEAESEPETPAEETENEKENEKEEEEPETAPSSGELEDYEDEDEKESSEGSGDLHFNVEN